MRPFYLLSLFLFSWAGYSQSASIEIRNLLIDDLKEALQLEGMTKVERAYLRFRLNESHRSKHQLILSKQKRHLVKLRSPSGREKVLGNIASTQKRLRLWTRIHRLSHCYYRHVNAVAVGIVSPQKLNANLDGWDFQEKCSEMSLRGIQNRTASHFERLREIKSANEVSD